MTLTYIFVGLAAWTLVSVLVGLGLAAIMRTCAAGDELVVPVCEQPPMRKSA
jgi:hypothetical protein